MEGPGVSTQAMPSRHAQHQRQDRSQQAKVHMPSEASKSYSYGLTWNHFQHITSYLPWPLACSLLCVLICNGLGMVGYRGTLWLLSGDGVRKKTGEAEPRKAALWESANNCPRNLPDNDKVGGRHTILPLSHSCCDEEGSAISTQTSHGPQSGPPHRC